MSDSKRYFSALQVKNVAEKMHVVSKSYEQLFTDLGSQIYVDILDLTNPSEIMKVCIKNIDDAMQAFQDHFPDTSVIACGKGCHYCCSFPIECPPQVILDIAHHVTATFSKKEMDLLRQKLTLNIKQRDINPMKRAECPFLNKEKNCSIYEKRPLSCRWFTSPDAKMCKQSIEDGRNIPQHPILHRIYQVATSAMVASAKNHGCSHSQIPFIPSLLDALENNQSPL